MLVQLGKFFKIFHLSVMHLHFICAGAKRIFTCLCYLYVFQTML